MLGILVVLLPANPQAHEFRIEERQLITNTLAQLHCRFNAILSDISRRDLPMREEELAEAFS